MPLHIVILRGWRTVQKQCHPSSLTDILNLFKNPDILRVNRLCPVIGLHIITKLLRRSDCRHQPKSLPDPSFVLRLFDGILPEIMQPEDLKCILPGLLKQQNRCQVGRNAASQPQLHRGEGSKGLTVSKYKDIHAVLFLLLKIPVDRVAGAVSILCLRAGDLQKKPRWVSILCLRAGDLQKKP